MKTFNQYIKLRETSAFNVGTSILGRSTLDSDSESALTAAIQGFELIMSKNPQAAASFLTHMSTTMPELQAILQQHGLSSFRDSDFKNAMRKGAKRGSRVVTKGLGDVSPQDLNGGGDVVAMPHADSFANPMG